MLRKPVSQVSRYDWPGIKSNALRWLDTLRGFSVDVRREDVTVNVASVAANTTVEQTFTVTGLKVNDVVISVAKPTLSAGLGVLQGRASADDTLAIQFINTTGSAIDPASEVYELVFIKNSKN